MTETITDKTEALAAVKDYGWALEQASDELKADKEVVMAAVQENGLALECASDELKADKEVVMAAVKKYGQALQQASDELKADKEVVMAAVNSTKFALEHASDELKADKEVFMVAVKNDGLALEYASDELKADKEVVMAAVQENISAFDYASDELKTDPEILDIESEDSSWILEHALGGIISSDAPADLKNEDYKHNHCIVFFGINQESFKDIQWTFENSDGADGLSLLRSPAGVIMTNFCSYKAGSETVKEKITDQKELRGWVEEEFNNNTEEFKDQFVSDENSEIASDFLELLDKEKPFLLQHIQVAMTIWANSEFFEQDDFMGAMFLFFKSSKKFDKDDIVSENHDRMNMVLTSSFLSACFGNLNNCLKVNYIIDDKVSSIYGGEEDEDGDFCHDYADEGITMLGQNHEPGGNEIGHLFRFHDQENPHSDPHNDYKNDLAYYFDQDGRGWKVEEINRKGAVSLFHECLDNGYNLIKY